MTRLGILATSLTGDRPTGLGIYAQAVLEKTPWPEDAVLLGDAAARRNLWRERPWVETPRLGGLGPRLLWQLARLDPVARAARCDLLYAPTHELSPSVSVPTVIVVHDLIPLLFPELVSRKLAGFFAHLLPRACEKAAALIAISDSTRRDLISHYGLAPNRITVVPNGFERARFKPQDADRVAAWKAQRGLDRYVLYVGRLSRPKNIAALVEGLARVAREVPHQLALIGPDEKGERARLEQLAAKLGIAERLRVLDYVPADELPLAYAGASLFATASLYEGFGLPPLEAMACGTPVLVSDASSLPEVVGDAGARVDPRSPDAIGKQLAELLGSPSRLRELSRRGLTRAAQFSWERTGTATRAVIDAAARRVGSAGWGT